MERLFFQSSGGQVSFLRRRGEIPTVFIHGFTASADIWQGMESHIDGILGMICIDLPGHGESRLPTIPGLEEMHLKPGMVIHYLASVVNELIESLRIERYHLVGSSMGGWVALDLSYSFRKPESAVLIDCAGLMSMDDRKFAKGFLELLKEYSDGNSSMGKMLLSMVGSSQPEDFTMDSKLLENADFRTCVIWGSRDHILDPSYGKKLSEKLEESEFHLIEGADHVPFRTHPVEVAEIINSFISSRTPEK